MWSVLDGRRWRIFFLWVLLGLAAGPAEARPDLKVHDTGRVLAGHTFLPSLIGANPFITTSVGTITAFGVATYHVLWPRDEEAEYELVAVQQALRAEVALLPVWNLRLGAFGQAFTGINSDAVLGAGLYAQYGVEGGTQASFRIGRFRLGGSVDVVYTSRYSFQVRSALVESVMAREISTETLFQEIKDTALVTSFNAAVGLHPSVGLVLAMQYQHHFTDTEGVASYTGWYHLLPQISFDLKALSPVPLGLTLAYRLGVPLKTDPGLVHDVGPGLFYTGRPRDLALGVEVLFRVPPELGALDGFTTAGTFVLRYYW